ncbi:MAG TPA: 50S ribosomal protein L4, partial [Candidatus Woesebacteria bacterium]|nr:50S ribosomal protein L4 [Candidatus Woesebacteria bacterium]
MILPKVISLAQGNDKLIAQAVRVFLNNQRCSRAKTKSRGEVVGTTKKMWAQKGTGRARHGTAKAPQFVGGGRAHGPRGNQNFKLKLPQKQRRLAILSVLARLAQDKRIMVIDGLSQLEAKTKMADGLITCLSKTNEVLSKSRRIGIITSRPLKNVKRAFGNLPGIEVLNLHSLNIFNLADKNFLIFTRKALNDFK